VGDFPDWVTALDSLQCFDTVGWVTGKAHEIIF